jgi:hypothetical protein
MSTLIEKIKSLSRVQWIAIALIVFGVGIMSFKSFGISDNYKEVKFAVEHNFAAGNPSTDLLRPWMTIRYIAAAYDVPQQYIFDAAHIQPKRETSLIALERLNRQMKLGQVNGEPVLMKTIGEAITAYRANPVATGLIERHVEDWMPVQYIANSTGIPAETILQSVGIPVAGNMYKPLGFLSDQVNYPGGKKALIAAIQKIVDAQGKKPVIP